MARAAIRRFAVGARLVELGHEIGVERVVGVAGALLAGQPRVRDRRRRGVGGVGRGLALVALEVGAQTFFLVALRRLLGVGADVLDALDAGGLGLLPVLLVLLLGGDAVLVLLRRPVVVGFLLGVERALLIHVGDGAASQAGDGRAYGDDCGVAHQLTGLDDLSLRRRVAALNEFKPCWPW